MDLLQESVVTLFVSFHVTFFGVNAVSCEPDRYSYATMGKILMDALGKCFASNKLAYYRFEINTIQTIAARTKDLIKQRATSLEIENQACLIAIGNYGAMFT